jgi:hypothetical protein
MTLDTYYKIALDELEKRMAGQFKEAFDIQKQQLLSNLADEQLFGPTPTSKNDRIRAIAALNRLAQQAGLDTNFTALWQVALQYGVIPQEKPQTTPSPEQKPELAARKTCIDLEIHVGPLGAEGYPVRVTVDGKQHFSGGNLVADVVNWQPGSAPAESGRQLFDALFVNGPTRDGWNQARGQAQAGSLDRRVRLHIDAGAPELHAIPWERLHENDVMLAAGAKTPFSRYLPSSEPWGDAVKGRPIRVLAVISDPKDAQSACGLPPVDVDEEQFILENAFSKLDADHITLDFLPAPVTQAALGDALREGYHVLHFVGHGKFYPAKQQAVLLMQDADGNAEEVADDVLSAMLARQASPPRLVFLAACQSAARSHRDAFLGLAPRLVRAGVPAVVAMQDDVPMKTARELGRVFYGQVAQHGAVDRALNEARDALLNASLPGAATPVLFMRLEDGQLWGPT